MCDRIRFRSIDSGYLCGEYQREDPAVSGVVQYSGLGWPGEIRARAERPFWRNSGTGKGGESETYTCETGKTQQIGL